MAGRRPPFLLLKDKTVTLWWAASCFRDLLLMCLFQHQKKYSSEEYRHRLQVFASNLREINAHNARNHTFKSTWGHLASKPLVPGRREQLRSGKKWMITGSTGLGSRARGEQPPRLWSWAWLTSHSSSAVLWDSRGCNFRVSLRRVVVFLPSEGPAQTLSPWAAEGSSASGLTSSSLGHLPSVWVRFTRNTRYIHWGLRSDGTVD